MPSITEGSYLEVRPIWIQEGDLALVSMGLMPRFFLDCSLVGTVTFDLFHSSLFYVHQCSSTHSRVVLQPYPHKLDAAALANSGGGGLQLSAANGSNENFT